MFFYMVKKEITQALRNKFNLFLLFIFPIISITCMGFALNDLMEGNGNLFKGEKIEYSLHGESFEGEIYENNLRELCENLNVDFKRKEQDAKQSNSIFIAIEGDKIIYREGNNTILNSLIENYLKEVMFINETVKETNIYESNEIYTSNVIKEIKLNKGISAFHYYGFVQIVLIIMYLSLTLGESVNREWEEDTLKRVIISKANKGLVLMSKVIVGIIIGSFQIFEGVIFTKIIIGVDWGTYIKEMIALLFLFSIVCCIFGVLIGVVIKDGKSLSTIINITIIVFSMFGGAYFPLSFIKNLPIIGGLSKASPVYWVNEGLINLSVGNYDTVVNIAFLYLILLIVGMMIFYFIYEGIINERIKG